MYYKTSVASVQKKTFSIGRSSSIMRSLNILHPTDAAFNSNFASVIGESGATFDFYLIILVGMSDFNPTSIRLQ